MGPRSRYLGPEVPAEVLIWQDPVPAVDHELIDAQDITALKSKILASGLSVSQLVSTAWASASTFRAPTSAAGERGAHSSGATEGLGSQPTDSTEDGVGDTRGHPKGVQRRAVRREEGVARRPDAFWGGCAGVEQAAKNAGHDVTVPFTPGRTDATQEQTDAASFTVLEPAADGFLNYLKTKYAVSAEELLVDRAQTVDADRS